MCLVRLVSGLLKGSQNGREIGGDRRLVIRTREGEVWPESRWNENDGIKMPIDGS